MSTTLRALASLLLIVGFYVLALGAVAGLTYGAIWSFATGVEGRGIGLIVLALIVAGAFVVALRRAVRAKRRDVARVSLDRTEAPELWSTVEDLARLADTRPPDEILLGPEVNAGVAEDTRLLGLVGGRRRMVIGVPLLHGLTVDQLRAALAHELGHYSLLSTAAIFKRQEIEADRLSVRAVGAETAAATLREIGVIDSAWASYLTGYVNLAWENEYAPTAEGFFGGFPEFLAARGAELAERRAVEPSGEESRWDSHPRPAERIAMITRSGASSADDGAAPPASPDRRPAVALVPGLESAAARLAELVVDFGSRTRLAWPELIPAGCVAHDEQATGVFFRVVGRVTGRDHGDLDAALDVVAAGRGAELVLELTPQAGPAEVRELLTDALRLAINRALVTAGAATWRHSWSGAAVLIAPDGSEFDVAKVAALAADADRVGEARARLAEWGIDLAAMRQGGGRTPDPIGEVVGGLANAMVDGVRQDVLILDTGLVLAPCPRETEGGRSRLEQLAAVVPVLGLRPPLRFLATPDIASAQVLDVSPARVKFTRRDGTTTLVEESPRGATLTDEAPAELLTVPTSRPRPGHGVDE